MRRRFGSMARGLRRGPAAAPPGAAYDDLILGTAGLTHFYPMDEAAGVQMTDVVAASHGTYTNTPALNQGGFGEPVVGFNGVDEYVVLPSFNLGNLAAMSVEFLAAFTSGTQDRYLWGEGSSTDADPILAVRTGPLGTLRVFRRNNVSGSEVETPQTVAYADGLLHHVALVKNGLNHKLYVDGGAAEIDVTPGSLGGFTVNRHTFAALGRAAVSSFFAGSLAKLAIYNVALDQATIDEHAAARPS